MPIVPTLQPPSSEPRQQAFTVTPGQLGLSEKNTGPVWGVIMETGYSEALVSLVVFAEGTTSIYFGNGGGVIGAGEHQPVRAAGRKLLIQAAEHLSQLLPVASPVLPRVGEIRFYFFTYSGLRGASANEEVLGAGHHPLSIVFYAAHDVITQVRETSPK